VRWATDDFSARSVESPRLSAELVVSHALGVSRVQLVVDSKRPLAPEELARIRELVKRRRAHEPMAYLTGTREFYGRMFRVDRRVLIPRPDTETLVEVALARTAARSMSMRALDLCTGSGCVAITLARQRPTSRVHAADKSADAVALARENALRLGAYNVSFSSGDLFDAVPAALAPFDVIAANPPYIPTARIAELMPDVRDFEPRAALDGGLDGLDLVRRIVDRAPAFLAPGAALAIEVGEGQAPDVSALFAGRGFTDIAAARDYAKIERVVHGIRPTEALHASAR
jgi:release factor glutamine methyltransferase